MFPCTQCKKGCTVRANISDLCTYYYFATYYSQTASCGIGLLKCHLKGRSEVIRFLMRDIRTLAGTNRYIRYGACSNWHFVGMLLH